jgi:hypothetical protein
MSTSANASSFSRLSIPVQVDRGSDWAAHGDHQGRMIEYVATGSDSLANKARRKNKM